MQASIKLLILILIFYLCTSTVVLCSVDVVDSVRRVSTPYDISPSGPTDILVPYVPDTLYTLSIGSYSSSKSTTRVRVVPNLGSL